MKSHGKSHGKPPFSCGFPMVFLWPWPRNDPMARRADRRSRRMESRYETIRLRVRHRRSRPVCW